MLELHGVKGEAIQTTLTKSVTAGLFEGLHGNWQHSVHASEGRLYRDRSVDVTYGTLTPTVPK